MKYKKGVFQMELKPLQCPNCHAPVKRIEGAHHMFCPYCGTEIVMDDIEFYREDSETEREKIRADRDVEKDKIKKEIIKGISDNVLYGLLLVFDLVLFILMFKLIK